MCPSVLLWGKLLQYVGQSLHIILYNFFLMKYQKRDILEKKKIKFTLSFFFNILARLNSLKNQFSAILLLSQLLNFPTDMAFFFFNLILFGWRKYIFCNTILNPCIKCFFYYLAPNIINYRKIITIKLK